MPFGGESAESYHDEGLTALMKGDLGQAVAHFERAIEFDRSFFPAYHQLAKCFLRTGDRKRAVGILRQVALARPGMIVVRVDLGLALIDLEKFDEARQVLGEVLRAKPDQSRAQFGLAQCAFAEGKWDEAFVLAESLANQGTPSFGALLLLGRAAGKAGRLDVSAGALERADRLIQKFIETSPDQPEGYYLRGEVQAGQEAHAKALECYAAAQERCEAGRQYGAYGEHFSLVDVLAREGACYRRLGADEQARAVGEEILRIAPEHPAGRALIGG